MAPLEAELPLDLIVLADFGLAPDSPLSQRLHQVAGEDPAELLRRSAPAITLAAGLRGDVTLAMSDFRTFRPEGLVAQSPELGSLLELRRRLASASPPGAEELKQALAMTGADTEELLRDTAREPGARARSATSPPPAAPGARPPGDTPPAPARSDATEPLDAIFGLVDVSASGAPADRQAPASRMLDALISDLVGRPAGAPLSRDVQERWSTVLDAALARTLRRILHATGFQSVESAWLGLRFLVRRVAAQSGIRIQVLSVPRAGLRRAIEETVVPFATEARAEGRVVCALLDFDLADTADGLAEAEAVARLAEAACLPVIASATPEFCAAVGEPVDPDDPDRLAARERWRALRATEAARWLVVATNPFLLRSPYGAELDAVRGFGFEESPAGHGAAYLWGRAPWALGTLVAQSFARTGWGATLTGSEGGLLEDLPVRPLTLTTGEIVSAPLETLPSENRVLELSRAGIVALVSRRNSDQALVVSAPVVHSPAAGGNRAPSAAESRRATLGYQLFVAQVTALIAHLTPWLDRSRPRAQLAQTLAKSLEFLTSTREGPCLSVSPAGDALDEAATLELRITPIGGPLRGLPDFAIGLPAESPPRPER